MGDPVVWGYKAVKPFNAEHPVGTGTMVRYEAGDEVPAGDWGRAEAFMTEAGTIMRYVRGITTVPNALPASVAATRMDEPVAVPTEAPAEPPPADEEGDADGPPDGLAVPDDATFPHNEGGGWYVLSDGSRVRGKSVAIAGQAELDVAAENEVTV